MSNVLIGIIGVILFIGLALAGAMFLGPRFQETTMNSQAASIMSSLKQASDAADLRMVDLGVQTTPVTRASFLMTGGYLKSEPRNVSPSAKGSTSYLYSIQFNNNVFVDGNAEPQYAARFVMTPIGTEGDEGARALCSVIARSYGQTSVPVAANDFPDPATPVGCMLGNGVNGRFYIAYSRINTNAGEQNPASNWTAGQP